MFDAVGKGPDWWKASYPWWTAKEDIWDAISRWERCLMLVRGVKKVER